MSSPWIATITTIAVGTPIAAEQWMFDDGESGKDSNYCDEERPNPWYGMIDENAYQREDPHDQPINAKECHDRDCCCAGLGDEQQTQCDARYSLKQKNPPDF
jgi:hypothetical protein